MAFDPHIFEPMLVFCERPSFSVPHEPLALASNLIYLLTSAEIYRRSHSHPATSVQLRLLAIVGPFVGISSSLYHAFSHVIGGLFDDVMLVAYILLFTTFYLLSQRQSAFLSKRNLSIAALCVLTPIGLSLILGWFEVAKGSDFYLGVGLAFIYLGASDLKRIRGRVLGAAGLCLLIGLLARVLDPWLCAAFPTRIHFLWHIFSSAVIYLSAMTLSLSVRNKPFMTRKWVHKVLA